MDALAHAEGLEDLTKAGRRVRRHIFAHDLARQCQEGATYTLGDLCQLAGVSATMLEDRLAVAKVLYKNPLIFQPQRTLMEGEGLALYSLAPEWSEMLAQPEELPPPDQNWLQEMITYHLGHADDLYRRSIDPDSGDITLAFHFPAIAEERYRTEIATIAEETGVLVNIAPQPHQGELVRIARVLLPTGLSEYGTPSIYHESQIIQIKCQGEATPEAIKKTQEDFQARTGWSLELARQSTSKSVASQSVPTPTLAQVRIDQNRAIQSAHRLLYDQPGYVKVGAEPGRYLLHARFHFPEVARQRYADLFSQIEAQTGWQVLVQEGTNQGALAQMAGSVLPVGLTPINSPSIYHSQQTVIIKCKGSASWEEILAAQQRFSAETGWELTISAPNSRIEVE